MGTKRLQDERVKMLSDKQYADTYWLVLLMSGVVGGVMLSLDRTIWIYLPIFVAVGGSLCFLLVRYALHGILFSRDRDERIDAIKTQTKARCHLFCFAVYLLSGGIFVFVLPDNPTANFLFLIWVIPAFVALIKSVKKGVAGVDGVELFYSNSKNSDKRTKAILIKATISASLLFGAFAGFFIGEPETFLDGLRTSLLSGATFGIGWYFFMRLIAKRSEKNADKLAKQADETSEDEEH